MDVISSIQHKKEIFKLPFQKDQLEYWGPVDNDFADSFLTMGRTFIYQYFNHLDPTFLKTIFSSFVEMMQNLSDYNENHFENNEPKSYMLLEDGGKHFLITTINRIEAEDKATVQTIFQNAFSIPKDQLQTEYKKLLLTGGHLGLMKLRKVKNANLEYSLSENQEGETWLGIELKINYGNT
jgi:hypothetical protein